MARLERVLQRTAMDMGSPVWTAPGWRAQLRCGRLRSRRCGGIRVRRSLARPGSAASAIPVPR